MGSNSISLSRYIAWLSKKYNELLQETQNTEFYRIVEIKNYSYDNCKIRVHVVGTDKTIELSPKDIIADDALIEGFAKKDIRTISYYACKEINKPTLKIVSHSFSDRLKKIIFFLKNAKTNEQIEDTASNISLNKEMIMQLSSEDAHRIGYLCGNEDGIKEKEMIYKLKNKNSRKNNNNLMLISENKRKK